MRLGLWRWLCIAFLACVAPLAADDTPANWALKDARYRAVIRLNKAPGFSDAGVAIETPEFGQTREDARDVSFTDNEGHPLPITLVWRGAGKGVLLLTKALTPGKDYFLYSGGSRRMSPELVLPRAGLLLETRPLPPGTSMDAWPALQDAWRRSHETDGAAFVDRIYQGENPFGASWDFMSHYSGYLQTKGLKHVFLYTLSCDASYVLVDDVYAFGWPGKHDPNARPGEVHGMDVACPTDWTKIDYYQAKSGDGGDNHQVAMVLGWRNNDKLEAIPAEAWLRPGTSTVTKLEEEQGLPVPLPAVKVHSFIGYGGNWYYDTERSVPETQGWSVQWLFDDGSAFSGPSCRRILPGPEPRKVTVTLTRGKDVLRGMQWIGFNGDFRMASINDSGDVAWYVGLLKGETPSPFGSSLERDLIFLLQFGDEETTGRFAGAWLKENIGPLKPLWIDTEVAWLRYLAQSDPKHALAELHTLSPEIQRDYSAFLDPLEMELVVFYQHGPAERLRQLALKNIGNPLERLADIRLGDLDRLRGDYTQAATQYLAVEKKIVDDSENRKLPTEDRAFSITVDGLIQTDHRNSAERKLEEWEFRHPAAKLDTDFLLLRARMLMLFGRWKEALTEIDSFEKMQTDSPYQIDADFYRARLLYETGQKDEARKIWNSIVKNYPRNDLAAQSALWATKP